MLSKMNAERMKDFDPQMRQRIEESERRQFANNTGKTVAALLAAGRENDAKGVADRAVGLQDDAVMRSTIVKFSLDAEQARQWHLDLLDGVENIDDTHKRKVAPMRERVESMLRG